MIYDYILIIDSILEFINELEFFIEELLVYYILVNESF